MLSISKFLKGLRILNDADQTKQAELAIDVAATTNTKTLINIRQSSDRTLSTPNDGLNTEILTSASAQTITAKTIVVASNTVTTSASGNLVSTELNAALSELQTDVDTRATQVALANHNSSSSGIHGVIGTVVGTSDTQVLTNKTIDGSLNTISNINVSSISGVLPISKGGTGQSTNSLAFDALSPNTTKGDIIINNGSSNLRFAIGADGQILSADSTQPLGVKWTNSSGGVSTTIITQIFNGTGSLVMFTLSNDPVNKENTQVYISGVYQQKDTYTLGSSIITFSEAPPLGTANIEVVYFTAVSIGTVPNNSISTLKLQDLSVTTTKLDDLSVSTGKLINSSVTNSKLSSDSVSTIKILDGSVTNAKLADSSVGTNKLIDGSVTNVKLSAVNMVESSAAPNFGTTSISYVDVTNLSVTFTTSGRMLEFGLNSNANIQRVDLLPAFPSSSDTLYGNFRLVNVTSGNTTMAQTRIGSTFPSSSISNQVVNGPGCFRHFTSLSAGTYTVKLQILVNASTTNFVLDQIKLFVREL